MNNCKAHKTTDAAVESLLHILITKQNNKPLETTPT